MIIFYLSIHTHQRLTKQPQQKPNTHTHKVKKHAPKSCAQSYATLFCWCNSWGWMQHQLGSTSYKSLGFHPSSTSHSFTRPGRLEVAVLFWGRDWERGVFAIVFILWFLIFVSILVGLRILFLSIGGRNPVKQSVCIYIYIFFHQ